MSEPWWADAAATRPIRVAGGIQINSTRGAVARTWWSKRFLSVLEQIGVGGRMARGRAYARQGQIVSLDIDAGGAVAKVQGSRPRPYAVRVGVPRFGKAEWAEVAEAMVADASLTAALLAGDMPHEIEDVSTKVGLSLSRRARATSPSTARAPIRPSRASTWPPSATCWPSGWRRRPVRDPGAARPRPGDAARLSAGAARLRGPRPRARHPAHRDAGRVYTAGPLPPPTAGPDTPSDALLDQVPPFPVEIRGISVTELLRPVYRALGGA